MDAGVLPVPDGILMTGTGDADRSTRPRFAAILLRAYAVSEARWTMLGTFVTGIIRTGKVVSALFR